MHLDHDHIAGGAHEHSHEHTHTHEGEEHGHGEARAAKDEVQLRALLSYMLHHNEHHAEELVGLQDSLPESARKKLLLAVGTFEAANVQLQQVLDELDKLE